MVFIHITMKQNVLMKKLSNNAKTTELKTNRVSKIKPSQTKQDLKRKNMLLKERIEEMSLKRNPAS